MRLMTFVNPMFHEGRNCTVRRGKFWSCLKRGEEIALVRSLVESKERIVAVIEEVKTLRYRELKIKDLKDQHIEQYRGDKKKLLEGMKRIHKGKAKFSANETVTIIYFSVKSRAYVGPYGKLIYY